jgi:hypothetical protein
MEENVNVTEMAEEIEHVEGDVVDAIDTAKETAMKVFVDVSDDVGEGISTIAKGVGVLAITGTVTLLGAAGYGIYKGAKWLGGKISNGKKQKENKAAEQPVQAENTEAVQQEQTADDNKKAKK